MTNINFRYYVHHSNIHQINVEFNTETGEYTRFPKEPEKNTDLQYPKSIKKALILLQKEIKKTLTDMDTAEAISKDSICVDCDVIECVADGDPKTCEAMGGSQFAENLMDEECEVIPPHEHIWGESEGCIHCGLTKKEFKEKTKPKEVKK